MSELLKGKRLEGLVITVSDIQQAGHCVRGAKRWFEHHGFDFRKVLKEGISAYDLAATGDAQAEAVVLHKLKQVGE